MCEEREQEQESEITVKLPRKKFQQTFLLTLDNHLICYDEEDKPGKISDSLFITVEKLTIEIDESYYKHMKEKIESRTAEKEILRE